MPWPAFNKLGDLPVGVYRATIAEVMAHFGQSTAQRLFRHDTAQDELGASIFWVNAETSFADTEDLIIGWQTRRDLQRRGIVEVMEHD
ncbi:MAG: hypothetical protein HYZ89_01405 [Candidatus Omnitrophica bacterium]|nr:hypothetical protein [Candidatus Omnitrophota bacterium]